MVCKCIMEEAELDTWCGGAASGVAEGFWMVEPVYDTSMDLVGTIGLELVDGFVLIEFWLSAGRVCTWSSLEIRSPMM